jgi:hypothetical protein
MPSLSKSTGVGIVASTANGPKEFCGFDWLVFHFIQCFPNGPCDIAITDQVCRKEAIDVIGRTHVRCIGESSAQIAVGNVLTLEDETVASTDRKYDTLARETTRKCHEFTTQRICEIRDWLMC